VNKFIKINDTLYNVDDILFVDASLVEDLILTVYPKDRMPVEASGLEAIDIIMTLKPSLFEGKRLRFPKRMWIVHNLIAHPLMQLLALVGFRKQALWLHEVTVPRPLGKR
jgi:hypothetical protein